jgi:hypothetical protein
MAEEETKPDSTSAQKEDFTINLNELTDEAISKLTREERIALIDKLQRRRPKLMRGGGKAKARSNKVKAKVQKEEQVPD